MIWCSFHVCIRSNGLFQVSLLLFFFIIIIIIIIFFKCM